MCIRDRHYIEDMLTAATRIGAYTTGMSLADFEASALTIDATLHNFVVMGEAAARVPQPIRDRAVDVPWGRIRGMRNVLVHGYAKVNLAIVWETIVDDLPGLQIALQAILDREP